MDEAHKLVNKWLLDADVDVWHEDVDDLTARIAAALRDARAAGRAEAADEITQLRALIDAYAEHDGSCAVYRDGDECSCGYRDAKQALDRP